MGRKATGPQETLRVAGLPDEDGPRRIDYTAFGLNNSPKAFFIREGAKVMIKKPDNPRGNAHRVITFLTRDELDFLDKVGKDALFSAGTKLSRSKIISAIVNVIRRLKIDGRNLSSKKELEGRIVKAMEETIKNNNDKSKEKTKMEEGGENGTIT